MFVWLDLDTLYFKLPQTLPVRVDVVISYLYSKYLYLLLIAGLGVMANVVSASPES